MYKNYWLGNVQPYQKHKTPEIVLNLNSELQMLQIERSYICVKKFAGRGKKFGNDFLDCTMKEGYFSGTW